MSNVIIYRIRYILYTMRFMIGTDTDDNRIIFMSCVVEQLFDGLAHPDLLNAYEWDF